MGMRALVCTLCLLIPLTAAARSDEAPCAPSVQQKAYAALLRADQDMRTELLRFRPATEAEREALRRRIIAQDPANQAALDALVAQCGWPGDDAEPNANLAAALIVIQHAPLAYMERYEARIMQANQRGRVSGGFMAAFLDRLLARQAQARGEVR